MDTLAFLGYLTAQPSYSNQIAHIEHIPPGSANCAELDKPLLNSLEDCLRKNGLLPLYTHQAEAVNLTRQGRNVMVATSSASGKTLCYNIAVIQAMLEEPHQGLPGAAEFGHLVKHGIEIAQAHITFQVRV